MFQFPMRRGLRAVFLCVAPALLSLNAGAQQAPAAAAASNESLEEVIVTGTRILAPNLTSTSPVQVVTAKEIQLSGKTDVIDILNQLPQNFQNAAIDFSNTSSGLSTPGGISTADLRGLGPQRTLVLINGRRLGVADANTANPNPAPDLDQIPVSLLERVDVVTGGASATYGSDAIGGVINFITKRNFQGLQIDGQLGENWHMNHNVPMQEREVANGFSTPEHSQHDGRSRDFNLMVGTNFADGEGNVTAYFGFHKQDPVQSGARDFANCQLETNSDLASARCIGTSNSNLFLPSPLTNGTAYSVVGNQLLPYPQAGSVPPAQYNSQALIDLSRADQRYTAGFMAHDDLFSYLKPYVEFGFMNDKTTIDIAPSGLFQNKNPLDPITSNYNINCSNPFLSAQEASLLCSPAQIAADAANPGSVSANVQIGRRNIEGGDRSSLWEHNNYRAVLGTKGDFAGAWNYDVYGQYYYTTLYNTNDNYLNYQSITNALQVTGTAANPVCISGGACVPYNIFTAGAVTPTMLNYLYTNGTSYGTVTERIVHGDITGDLGKYGVKLPWANEGLGINLGYEHRSDSISFGPDSAELSGLLAGFGGASVSLNNGYSLKEGFVELRAPLVQDKPFAKDLVFDTAFRDSDYSTAGSVSTYKFEVQYSPLSDLRFRGGFQRAIRAPNLIELYTPPSVGGLQSPGIDPCAPTRDANNNLIAATASLAQCQHTGVTAAQYGNGSTTDLVPQCIADQCSQEQGGNPDLKPEKSDSYTVGLTLTPTFLHDFTGSIDYFRIKLTDSVGALPANVILQDCLNTGNPVYCSQIVRSGSGSINGPSVASGGYIVQRSVNVGEAVFEGVDIQTDYKLALPEHWGALDFSLSGSALLKTTTTPYPGAHTYDCAGLYGAACQNLSPRWRHNLRVSWDMPWNVTLSAYWRFIGKVSLDNNSSDVTLNGAEFGPGTYDAFNATLPSVSYIDLAATWSVTHALQVRAGINNLLDKDPPVVTQDIASGLPNAYPSYDLLGRQLFIAFTLKL